MTPLVHNLTTLLAAGTIAGDTFIVFAIVSLWHRNALAQFFAQNALRISFLIALAGTASSLFYSEIAGFLPCTLCWWQRIFLYPQVVMLGFAVKYKEMSRALRKSLIVLASLGALFAAYHVYIQSGGTSTLIDCDAYGISCGQIFFREFGYVTIPVMALTGFLAILVLLMLSKKYENTV